MNRIELLVSAAFAGMFCLGAPAAAAESEQVRLRDGKTYEVATGQGMPLPFKSRQIEIMGLGPAFSTSGRMTWFLHAKLLAKGRYTATASSLLEPGRSFKFDCEGPGEVTQELFPDSEFPAVWQWYQEPGTSWVPFSFTFTEKTSGSKFQATQWTKFGPYVKVKVKQQLQASKAGK